ncbi:Mpo1-like protein [Motilimonas cestriensis]|uniref:Mpo1-like protein n=1 Tax=Motilimonas cestriensis TaxID=2742685 RepID=UPI003DA4B6EA
MKLRALLAWQWQDYAINHQSKINLWIHIIAVPIFVCALLALFISLFSGAMFGALVSVAVVMFSLVLQNLGHKQEAKQPAPFSSAGNFIARLLIEQCYTFPKFVFKGEWLRAVRKN